MTSRVGRVGLGEPQRALDADPGGRPAATWAGSKRTSQPVGACRPSAVGCGEALVELGELVRVEQDPHGSRLAAGEDVRVERRTPRCSPWRWSERVDHLAVGEVRGAPRGRQRDARRRRCANCAAGLCAKRLLGVGRPGTAPCGASGMTVIRSGSADGVAGGSGTGAGRPCRRRCRRPRRPAAPGAAPGRDGGRGATGSGGTADGGRVVGHAAPGRRTPGAGQRGRTIRRRRRTGTRPRHRRECPRVSPRVGLQARPYLQGRSRGAAGKRRCSPQLLTGTVTSVARAARSVRTALRSGHCGIRACAERPLRRGGRKESAGVQPGGGRRRALFDDRSWRAAAPGPAGCPRRRPGRPRRRPARPCRCPSPGRAARRPAGASGPACR